jgi:argininosuccinate lyase
METFSESVSIDHRLYSQDISGSIAHARMLSKCGIISEPEFEQIRGGLMQIQEAIEDGSFEWSVAMEDVHMNIEAALTSQIGEAGKKLHTARSRNDQVATDMRLFLREELDNLCESLTGLQRELVAISRREAGSIMPGYTHMQAAQPVTLGHHLLAWNEMLERDYQRLRDCRKRINVSPLGSAALAGTSYPIDREMTAVELGFDDICRNSLDAVSDRDFIIEFAAHASLLMVHLSRMSEELVLWSSDAYGFVDLGDQFCTGSSIMPQKKNPDVVELTRGKCGSVSGNLMALLMLMKGQPLAYNRDNQEDKAPLFDIVDTVSLCLGVFSAMIPGIKIDRARMRSAAENGYSTATDLADYLVRKNVPFRDAHEIVGKVVGFATQNGLTLSEIKLARLKQFCEVIDQDVFDALSVEGSVSARNHAGGTAPEQVELAATHASNLLDARNSKQG